MIFFLVILIPIFLSVGSVDSLILSEILQWSLFIFHKFYQHSLYNLYPLFKYYPSCFSAFFFNCLSFFKLNFYILWINPRILTGDFSVSNCKINTKRLGNTWKLSNATKKKKKKLIYGNVFLYQLVKYF